MVHHSKFSKMTQEETDNKCRHFNLKRLVLCIPCFGKGDDHDGCEDVGPYPPIDDSDSGDNAPDDHQDVKTNGATSDTSSNGPAKTEVATYNKGKVHDDHQGRESNEATGDNNTNGLEKTEVATDNKEKERDNKGHHFILKRLVLCIPCFGKGDDHDSCEDVSPYLPIDDSDSGVGGLRHLRLGSAIWKLNRFSKFQLRRKDVPTDSINDGQAGWRVQFLLHFIVAILSLFVVFGLVPPSIYGFIKKSDVDIDFKVVAVGVISLICVVVLATQKAFKWFNAYIKMVMFYGCVGIVISAAACVVIVKLSWFEATAATALFNF